MGLFDWLTKRAKPLSQMTRTELRRQELLLEKDRANLLNRVSDLARGKQELFEKGAKEKSPEIRRILAQEFDLKTSEQLMSARQLNIRSKELLTVTRLRMMRETLDRAKRAGSRLGMVTERDLIQLEKMIESDSVTAEIYQQRLDGILSLGDADTGSPLSESGQQVMDMWDKMDQGLAPDAAQAYDEADRKVRERLRAGREGA